MNQSEPVSTYQKNKTITKRLNFFNFGAFLHIFLQIFFSTILFVAMGNGGREPSTFRQDIQLKLFFKKKEKKKLEMFSSS